MKVCVSIVVLCFLISLSACSTFYNRHYTKGVFYEGFAQKAQPNTQPSTSRQPAAILHVPDSSQAISRNNLPEEKIPRAEEPQQAAKSDHAKASGIQKYIARNPVSSPVLKKTLKPLHQQIRASQHAHAVAGKAAFYILALALAVGIIVLAVYFLPAILIPSTSAFMTIVLLGAIVVVCVFAFLIYTLIKLLIELFKHKKEPEEDAF